MVSSSAFSAALAAALLWANGESVETTQVQLFSPSVRVNGMGKAGVALPDEPAGYYNPSAAALSSPAHTLQSRFYLSGMPVSLGMDWRSDSFSLALGRGTFSQEISRIYYPAEKDASVFDKSGVEVSILETVSIRRGSIDLDGYVGLKTSGWTVKSDGLFKIVAHFLDSKSPSSERDALQFLAKHLSISWSRFDYGDRNSSLFRGVGHSFIGLLF